MVPNSGRFGKSSFASNRGFCESIATNWRGPAEANCRETLDENRG